MLCVLSLSFVSSVLWSEVDVFVNCNVFVGDLEIQTKKLNDEVALRTRAEVSLRENNVSMCGLEARCLACSSEPSTPFSVSLW